MPTLCHSKVCYTAKDLSNAVRYMIEDSGETPDTIHLENAQTGTCGFRLSVIETTLSDGSLVHDLRIEQTGGIE